MYAVIQTGGKQYRVKEGDVLSVEKLKAEKGQTVDLDQVLLIEDGKKILVGTPVVENAVVRIEVLENYKDEKVIVFKKKKRKQYRRTKGHRQELTKIQIEGIYSDKSSIRSAAGKKPKAVPARKEAPKVEPKPAVAVQAPAKPKKEPKKAKAPATKAVTVKTPGPASKKAKTKKASKAGKGNKE